MAKGEKTRVSGGLFGTDYWVVDLGGGREEIHEVGTFGGVGDKVADGSPTAMGGYRLTDSSGNTTTDYGLRGVVSAQEAANSAGRISNLQAKGASTGGSSASSNSSSPQYGGGGVGYSGGYGGGSAGSENGSSFPWGLALAVVFITFVVVPFALTLMLELVDPPTSSQQTQMQQSATTSPLVSSNESAASAEEQGQNTASDPTPVELQVTTLVKLKVSHVKGEGPLYVTKHLDNRYLSVNGEIKTWETIKIVPKIIHVKRDGTDWVKVLSPVKGYLATNVIRIPIYESRSKKANVISYVYYNDRIGMVPGTMKDGWVQIGEPYWGWIYIK